MMNKSDKKRLEEHFGPRVLFDEPMWRHTTFRIGGPVDALITLKTEQELKDLIVWASNRSHPVMILGAGSNLLVLDGGVRGIMLKLADGFEEIHLVPGFNGAGAMIRAGAAVMVRQLGKYAMDQSLAGLNFALGIPGTVGGTIRTNAGAWGGCMADCISSIRVINRSGEIVNIDRDKLKFSYRGLKLEKDTIILSGLIKLEHSDPEALKQEAIRIQKKRRLTQPLSMPSAGSIFRNPPGDKAAGMLIDMAGLKGFRIGEAEVSTKHANFIMNKGHARASDVLDLIRHIQKTVFERFGVNLELEVTIVGQKEHS